MSYLARIESASTVSELEKIGFELKTSVKTAFVEKDLLLVRAEFGKRMQGLRVGDGVAVGGR